MLAQLTAPALYRRLASVAVVMLLSLSLVITTPSNAAAASTTFAPPPQVMGAIKTIGPAVLAVASVTPWGAILRTGLTLGIMAYSSREAWMPFFSDMGTWGSPDNDNPGTAIGSQQPYILQDLYVSDLQINGQTGSVSVRWNANSNNSGEWQTSVKLNCRTASGALSVVDWSISANSYQPYQVRTFATQCPAGSTMTGAVAGAGGTHPAFPLRSTAPGPMNVMTAGTYSPEGFNPKSPEISYTVSSECIDAAGNLSTVSATVAGDVGALKVASCEAAGKGHGTGKTDITALRPGETIPQPVWSVPRPTADPATPLCDPGRPGSGCVLSVELDGKPCEAGNVECENWAELQRNDPTNTRLKCRFGPYTLPMSACNLLEGAYWPGGAPATDANTDGNPDTRSNLDPNGNPVAPPAPVTSGQPVPGGAGQTAPDASTQQKNCFPTGWAALNPVEWVMKPVGCALESAFVPSPQVMQTQTTRIDTRFKTVGFQRVATSWLSTFESVGGGSGCSGPTITFSMRGVNQSLQPFSACAAPMSTVAGVSYAVSSIFIVLFGGLGIMRAIGAGFGFNFTMGRGGSE